MAGQCFTIAGCIVTPLKSWSRPDAEDFLFEEAALLDQWKLVEWRGLFVAECRYLIQPRRSMSKWTRMPHSFFRR